MLEPCSVNDYFQNAPANLQIISLQTSFLKSLASTMYLLVLDFDHSTDQKFLVPVHFYPPEANFTCWGIEMVYLPQILYAGIFHPEDSLIRPDLFRDTGLCLAFFRLSSH